MELDQLQDSVEHYSNMIAELKGAKQLTLKEIKQHKEKIAENEKRKGELDNEKELSQLTSAGARKVAVEKFSKIVTAGLRAIMQDRSEFIVLLTTKRNIPNATFKIKTRVLDRYIELDPIESKGGGIIDITALALRISVIEAFRQKGSIFFDEPLKHLSPLYRQSASEFIRQVSENLNKQIIVITHTKELADAAHNMIELTKNEKGETEVNE